MCSHRYLRIGNERLLGSSLSLGGDAKQALDSLGGPAWGGGRKGALDSADLPVTILQTSSRRGVNVGLMRLQERNVSTR